MIFRAFIAMQDNGDGSQGVFIGNSREECLEHLDRTEEQLEDGTYYDDGIIIEREFNLEELDETLDGIILKLSKNVRFDTDG